MYSGDLSWSCRAGRACRAGTDEEVRGFRFRFKLEFEFGARIG